MQTIIDLSVSAFAVVALLALIPSMRGRSDANRDVLGFIGLYAVVLGGLLLETVFFKSGNALQLVLVLLIAAIASFIVVRESAAMAEQSSKLVLLAFTPAMVGFVFFVVNGLANPSFGNVQLFGRAASFIALASIVFLGAFVRLRLQNLATVIISSVLVCLALTPVAAASWRPCDRFKCGPFGAIFTGIFESENALAMFVSIAILSLMLLEVRNRRWLILLPLAISLFASESRTAQVSLALSLLLAFLASQSGSFKSGARGTRPQGQVLHDVSRARHGFVTLFTRVSVTFLFFIGFYLVFNSNASDFSNRGVIWERGVDALGRNWGTGLGMDRWLYLQTVGLLPPLFPHSQYLILLFGGGIVAVLLTYALMQSALVPTLVRERPFSHSYVLYLSIMGITEAYWNPASFDGHTFLVLPLIFLVLKKGVDDHPRNVQGSPQRVTHTWGRQR
ncbi:O-antigen ligase family protein [Arthrobacter sp. MDT3-44]